MHSSDVLNIFRSQRNPTLHKIYKNRKVWEKTCVVCNKVFSIISVWNLDCEVINVKIIHVLLRKLGSYILLVPLGKPTSVAGEAR